jgi:hypothetical protein
MTQILGVIVNGHWRPGIGDPTFMGWLTVAGYLIAAGLCGACAWRAERVSPADQFRQHRVFWWGLAVFMLLMGINKQLDLQSWFTAVGKQLAQTQGWYSQRRTFQMWFTASIAISGLILLMWLGWIFRRLWRQHGLALFGIVFLVTFIIIRAASFHHVEEFLDWQPAGFRMNWVLEIGVIACIGTSALISILRRTRKTSKTTKS